MEDYPRYRLNPSIFVAPIRTFMRSQSHDLDAYKRIISAKGALKGKYWWFQNLIFWIAACPFNCLWEAKRCLPILDAVRGRSERSDSLKKKFSVSHRSKTELTSQSCNRNKYLVLENIDPGITDIGGKCCNGAMFLEKRHFHHGSYERSSEKNRSRSLSSVLLPSNSGVLPTHCMPSRSFHNDSRLSEAMRPLLIDSMSNPENKINKAFTWVNSFRNKAVVIQPSKDFSLRKLIMKTTCFEKEYGLPTEHNFVRSTGPGINDSLIEYMNQKYRVRSDTKKAIVKPKDIKILQKDKMLVRNFGGKNDEFQMKKIKNKATNLTTNKTLRPLQTKRQKPSAVVTKVLPSLTNVGINKFNTLINRKTICKKSVTALNGKQKKTLRMEKPKPSTEYHSSASYRDVFHGIFSNFYKNQNTTKSKLAVFKREPAPAIRTISGPGSGLSTISKAKSCDIVRATEPEKLPGGNSPVNMKSEFRMPFKVSSNLKPRFTTVAETPLVGLSELFRKNRNKISSAVHKNARVNPAIKIDKRAMNTSANYNLSEKKKGVMNNLPVVNKTLYSALDYNPGMSVRKSSFLRKKEKSIENQKRAGIKERAENVMPQLANSYSGFFRQRALSTFVSRCNLKKTSRGGKYAGGDEARKIHTSYQPLQDELLTEVMKLCKSKTSAISKEGKTREKTSGDGKWLRDYGRCSLEQPQKPEGRRGLACRIASLLNVGCGSRGNKGCSKCGK